MSGAHTHDLSTRKASVDLFSLIFAQAFGENKTLEEMKKKEAPEQGTTDFGVPCLFILEL